MGDITGPEAALLVANFARGVSSELYSVKQKITSGEKHLAPVELDRQGLIAGLTGAAVPQDVAQQVMPDPHLDPDAAERAILEHEARQGQLPMQPVFQQRPQIQQPYSVGVAPPTSISDSMLNTIMSSLVSIERQLALLHKAIKQPKQSRTKKVQ